MFSKLAFSSSDGWGAVSSLRGVEESLKVEVKWAESTIQEEVEKKKSELKFNVKFNSMKFNVS